jgi:ATP-dependent DNA helicase RecG
MDRLKNFRVRDAEKDRISLPEKLSETGELCMTMNELLNRPEGKTLELKRDLSSLRLIIKTLVAFANTAGGVMIIGRDADGTIVGVDDVLAQEERLASAIADNIRPAMMPDIEISTCLDKSLLIARVPHWRGPFYLKAEGPEHGVYVRLGSTNRKAGPELLAEMQRSLAGISYDLTPLPDLTVADLDLVMARQTFSRLI